MNSLLKPRRPRMYAGLLRSLLTYYGRPDRDRRLLRFYAGFISPGDLCFDIGAHVGARTRLWTRLGANVIAVEPQPLLAGWLRSLVGESSQVTVIESAVAAQPGEVALHISQRTPTVSTLSPEWMRQVQQADSFRSVRWDDVTEITAVTLDQLIERYGVPAFCKIDIEGYEHEALLGLSHPIPALSVEYIPAVRDISLACIDRLTRLGDYRFNWSVGERHVLQSDAWLQPDEIRQRPGGNAGEWRLGRHLRPPVPRSKRIRRHRLTGSPNLSTLYPNADALAEARRRTVLVAVLNNSGRPAARRFGRLVPDSATERRTSPRGC